MLRTFRLSGDDQVDVDIGLGDICRRSGKLDRFLSDTPECYVSSRAGGIARSFVPRLRRRVAHTASVSRAVSAEIKLAASVIRPTGALTLVP